MAANTTHDSQIDEDEARKHLGKAEVFIRQDRPEEAWEQLGGQDEPPPGWPLLLRPHWAWLVGWTLFLLERPVDAVRCLEQGLQLARALHLRASSARQAYWDEMIQWLHCFLGVAHCAQGNTTLAIQNYQRGLEALNQRRIGNAELRLWIYKGLGNEYFALAKYQEAISFYQKALVEVKDSNNKRQNGLAAWGVARAYQQQGDGFRAKIYYRQALQELGEHGNRQLLAQIRTLCGLALIGLEDYEEAERQLRLGLEGARQVGDNRTCGMAQAYVASLHNAKGEPDKAVQAAQASLPLAQQSGDERAQGHALFALVDAYTAKRDWTATEQTYHKAIRLAERIPDFEMLSQARQGYAGFLAEQSRFQEAYKELALFNRTEASKSIRGSVRVGVRVPSSGMRAGRGDPLFARQPQPQGGAPGQMGAMSGPVCGRMAVYTSGRMVLYTNTTVSPDIASRSNSPTARARIFPGMNFSFPRMS